MARRSISLVNPATTAQESSTISSQLICDHLLDGSITFTTNQLVRQEDVRLTDEGSPPSTITALSSAQRPRSQMLIHVNSASGVFAIRCIVQEQPMRTQSGSIVQGNHHNVVAERHPTTPEQTRNAIYVKSVQHQNGLAWDYREVQNHLYFVGEGHENVLNLLAFASWTESVDSGSLLFLCHEYCDAGTLHDYSERCKTLRQQANESFVVGHAALQLVSVVKWLQTKGTKDPRIPLAHRNIRPENVFLKSTLGSEWPTVKLGGFDRLTPFDGNPDLYRTEDFRNQWSAPEFPESSEASDIWSVGAVIYATLAHGVSPLPISQADADTTFEDTLLELYHRKTRNIIRSMLMNDPSQRLPARTVYSLILEAKNTLKEREESLTWDMSEKAIVREQIEKYVTEYMAWLSLRVQSYLKRQYMQASRGFDKPDRSTRPSLGSKDVGPDGLPEFDIRRLRKQTDKVLTRWIRQAFEEGAESKLRKKITEARKLLAVNIVASVDTASGSYFHLVRAQFSEKPASTEDLVDENEGLVGAIVKTRITALLAYVQTLVQDVFWSLTRDQPEESLNVFPATDLFSHRAYGHVPSLGRICETLQSWIVTEYYRGMLQAAYADHNSSLKARLETRNKTINRIMVHFRNWFQRPNDTAYTYWLDRLQVLLKSSWTAPLHSAKSPKSALPRSVLAGLYQSAEDFTRSMVPVSTLCLSVSSVQQKEHRASRDKLMRFVGYLQKSWKQDWQLYSTSETPLLDPLDNKGAIVQPTFDRIGINFVAIHETQSRLRKELEVVLQPLSESYTEMISFYHTPDEQFMKTHPQEYTDSAKEADAHNLAGIIHLAPADGLRKDVDHAREANRKLRNEMIYQTAYRSIIKELRTNLDSTPQTRKENLQKAIITTLWSTEYATILCCVQREALRSIVRTGLFQCGEKLCKLQQIPTEEDVLTQVDDLVKSISEASKPLFAGQGYPPDSYRARETMTDFAEYATQVLMQWKDERDLEALKPLAVTFGVNFDDRLTRMWASFRRYYGEYLQKTVGAVVDLPKTPAKMGKRDLGPQLPLTSLIMSTSSGDTDKHMSEASSEEGVGHERKTSEVTGSGNDSSKLSGKEDIPKDEVSNEEANPDSPKSPSDSMSSLDRALLGLGSDSEDSAGDNEDPTGDDNDLADDPEELVDDNTSFGWSDLGENGAWPDSPRSSLSSPPAPSKSSTPRRSARLSKSPQTPPRPPKDDAPSKNRASNDSHGGSQRPAKSPKTIATTKAKEKEQDPTASKGAAQHGDESIQAGVQKGISKDLSSSNNLHAEVPDPTQVIDPSAQPRKSPSNPGERSSSDQPQLSKKRTYTFVLEKGIKRVKFLDPMAGSSHVPPSSKTSPWDRDSDPANAPTSWGQIGKALVQVVPGAKTIATTAANFFARQSTEATPHRQQNPSSSANVTNLNDPQRNQTAINPVSTEAPSNNQQQPSLSAGISDPKEPQTVAESVATKATSKHQPDPLDPNRPQQSQTLTKPADPKTPLPRLRWRRIPVDPILITPENRVLEWLRYFGEPAVPVEGHAIRPRSQRIFEAALEIAREIDLGEDYRMIPLSLELALKTQFDSSPARVREPELPLLTSAGGRELGSPIRFRRRGEWWPSWAKGLTSLDDDDFDAENALLNVMKIRLPPKRQANTQGSPNYEPSDSPLLPSGASVELKRRTATQSSSNHEPSGSQELHLLLAEQLEKLTRQSGLIASPEFRASESPRLQPAAGI